MIQAHDIFGRAEIPSIILCNPDRTELSPLGLMKDTLLSNKFNALSTFEFVYPSTIDGGLTIREAYPLLKAKKLISIADIGYFIISTVEEINEGMSPSKKVVCNSLEYELAFKRLTAFTGTYKFYELIPTSTVTLFDFILPLIPGWSVGTIDPTLWDIYRTFDITDTTIYNFLMTDAETSYGAVFYFDTVNKTINARKIENAQNPGDIYLSFDNVIKKSSLTEISSEMVTALSVYGGGDLTIRDVNPLGSNILYDYSYYKTTEWMDQSLIDAITAWEGAITTAQPTYATNLATLKTKNTELVNLNTDLTNLNIDYTVLETTLKTAIGAVPKVPADILAANTALKAKRAAIISKRASIVTKTGEINTVIATITAIVTSLSFANNFTSDQIISLGSFTYQNVYRNENIIVTDIMTPVDIQTQAQSLYDDAKNVIVKVAQPRYEFSMDTANFIALQEYSTFANELTLGSVITVNVSNDSTSNIQLFLLQMDMSYTDPSKFSLIFSNRLRLDNGSYQFTDIQGQVIKTGSTVSGSQIDWNNWTNQHKDNVISFVDNALDATKNNLLNGPEQELIIGKNGLIGKSFVSTDVYSDTQMWLTSEDLVFTKDNWDTASVALGKIIVDGSPVYGLAADVIIGRLIAGNNLTITNTGNTFTVDSNGATLTNATLSITNNVSRTLIDPANGIKIQKNTAFLPVTQSGTTQTTSGGPVTSRTWTHVVSSNVNRLLVVTVSLTSGTSVTGITYNSVALTKLGSAEGSTGGNNSRSEIWYLIAPTSGSHSVALTCSSTFIEVGSTEFYNADQTTPFGTMLSITNSAVSGASLSIPTTANNIVIDSLSYWSNTGNAVVGAGQTSNYNITSDGAWKGASSIETSSISPTIMSWTAPSPFIWTLCAVEINSVMTSAVWSDNFYADTNGDLVLTGTITADAGNIGSLVIDQYGIHSSFLNPTPDLIIQSGGDLSHPLDSHITIGRNVDIYSYSGYPGGLFGTNFNVINDSPATATSQSDATFTYTNVSFNGAGYTLPGGTLNRGSIKIGSSPIFIDTHQAVVSSTLVVSLSGGGSATLIIRNGIICQT